MIQWPGKAVEKYPNNKGNICFLNCLEESMIFKNAIG